MAKGLDWPIADVQETQYGAIMLTLDQNLGAYGIGDGKPLCMSIPDGAPKPPTEPSGWGKTLFGGQPDCVAGYLGGTWELFGQVYKDAEVMDVITSASAGLSADILNSLVAAGYMEKYKSNKWIGRVGL